ncbi:MAG TPA: DUF86 domain-containing protein [Thermoanaerobaculia bacterium]|nr:DUF86 domain-containing protein [Thermoanaerobaculia bacterium]
MVFNDESIRTRLLRLEEVISELERLRSLGREALRGSLSLMWAVERGLQLGAELIFDIGGHILTAQYGVSPDQYRNVVRLLVQQGVVSPDLQDRFKGMAGFRNVLVHDYVRLDPEMVLGVLERAPEDFSLFVQDIRKWLGGP